jgi:hypothetical protein
MSTPMTPAQADEKHMCPTCREGGDCGWDCILSATCSVLCQECKQGVYFTGNLCDQDPSFVCPTCGAQQSNRHLGKRGS